MQAKLNGVQAKLECRSCRRQNTYNIVPNQTLVVADGHLTVGLIGSPGNEGVTLNINGKEQTVAAGQSDFRDAGCFDQLPRPGAVIRHVQGGAGGVLHRHSKAQ